jgi:hypothetical protein
LTLTWLLTKTAVAVVRITDDRGGNIGAYWSRYMALRDTGEQIVIDGTCSSACTLVLGIVPHHRICVTSNAVLGFYAAWRPGFLGFEIINDPATCGTRTITVAQKQARDRESAGRTGGMRTNKAAHRRRIAPLLPQPCLRAPAQQRNARPIGIGLDKVIVVVEPGGVIGIAQCGPGDEFLSRRIIDRHRKLRRVTKLVLLHQLERLLHGNEIG